MLDVKPIRSILEAEVLTYDEYDPESRLAKEIVQYFKSINGEADFPREEDAKDDVEERLPQRKPRVVPDPFLRILRRGGQWNFEGRRRCALLHRQ